MMSLKTQFTNEFSVRIRKGFSIFRKAMNANEQTPKENKREAMVAITVVDDEPNPVFVCFPSFIK